MKLAGAMGRIFALNTPCPDTVIGAPVGWPRKSHGCAVATFIPRGK